jgi:hypothetical protein
MHPKKLNTGISSGMVEVGSYTFILKKSHRYRRP